MFGFFLGLGLFFKGMLGLLFFKLDGLLIIFCRWVIFLITRRNFFVKRKLEIFVRVFNYKWFDEKVKYFFFLN